jgi:hypothetical protein
VAVGVIPVRVAPLKLSAILAAELFCISKKLRYGLAVAIVTLVAVAMVGVVVVKLPAWDTAVIRIL